jgi:leucyl aminopeptidase
MKFTLDTTLATGLETACLVIGVFEDAPLHASAERVDQACAGALQQLVKSGDINTDWKGTTLLHGLNGVNAKRILVVGCGEIEKFNKVRYDSVCSSAGKFLRDHATTSAHICLHEIEVSQTTDYWRLRQAAANLARANYRYTATKKPKDDDKPHWMKPQVLPRAICVQRNSVTCRPTSVILPSLQRLHRSLLIATRMSAWKFLMRIKWPSSR